jgi:polysaccharide biosynthesis transport protein
MDNTNDKIDRIAGRNNPAGFQYPLPSEVHFIPQEMESDLQVHLMDYWKVLLKRRWLVLASILVFTISSMYITWRQPPIYRASLKLQIDNEQSNVLPFRDSTSFSYVPTEEYLKTQFEALTSRTLATRVINTLNLEKDPRFIQEAKPSAVDRILDQAKTRFSQRFQKKPTAIAAEPLEYPRAFAPHADSLLSSLTISPIKDSSVVIIGYDASDPLLASDIVNTFAAEYIQMNFETKYTSTILASKFLAKQLVDIKAQVENSEAALVKFGQTHNMYNMGERTDVILQKLSDLNAALTQSQADRIQKESIWKMTRNSANGQIPDSLNANDIRTLEGTVTQLQQQYAKLRTVYKPDWWEVKQIAGQLKAAEEQLVKVRIKTLDDIETAYRTALQREKLLLEAVNVQKSEANKLNEYSIQYNILKQEGDSNKQIYNGMLQRMKEAEITAGLKSNNIHVVDPAVPPGGPILPDKNSNLLKAILSGLIFGIALALFFEYVCTYSDRSLKTPEDVDRFVKLPFLGLIPSAESFTIPGKSKRITPPIKGRVSPIRTVGSNGHNPKQNIEMITFSNSKSLISEAYRHLRTSILLSSNGHSPKSIVITSSKRSEGKTNTCVNLAITLAQANKKVLLMDCDLRNPKINRILQLDNQEGVSTFLEGDTKPLNLLIKQTSIPNLFVLTSGKIPCNPSELIGSPRMKKCLAILSQRFDHIMIDTPPLLAVTDASILANIGDGVILVIRGGDTTREAIVRSKQLLTYANARIIGTMLNNVDIYNCGSTYYSRYFYGYDNDRAMEGAVAGVHSAVGRMQG